MDTTRRPFGYWIKQIDRGIDESFGRLLAAEGLTRRGWQVLHTVAAGPIALADLDAQFTPFLTDAEPTVRPHVDAFVERGWATLDGDTCRLTDDGDRTHERVSALVFASRKRITDGISTDEYATLVDLLQRVAANVESA